MACPFFMPVKKLDGGNWLHPYRLPLGGGWHGHCTAPGHEQQVPPQATLEACCNLGYARDCLWAPRECISDAVRFAVISPRQFSPSASPHGPVLRLQFVCERDHRPLDHGELAFDLTQSIWLRAHNDPRIQRMAECFVTSYLQKKG